MSRAVNANPLAAKSAEEKTKRNAVRSVKLSSLLSSPFFTVPPGAAQSSGQGLLQGAEQQPHPPSQPPAKLTCIPDLTPELSPHKKGSNSSCSEGHHMARRGASLL